MASIELNDNQAQIRGIDINRILVQGDHNYIYIDHNWIQKQFRLL